MPVHPDTPEPLKTALNEMETAVQSTKRSLGFAAPEIQDAHWAELQHSLADIIDTAIRKARAG
jgi:hypothetical protein